jgi:hypothetical protein
VTLCRGKEIGSSWYKSLFISFFCNGSIKDDEVMYCKKPACFMTATKGRYDLAQAKNAVLAIIIKTVQAAKAA